MLGVQTSILTVRTPRKTHVKDSGAHGANRPGPKVPSSLDQLKATYGEQVGAGVQYGLGGHFNRGAVLTPLYPRERGWG